MYHDAAVTQGYSIQATIEKHHVEFLNAIAITQAKMENRLALRSTHGRTSCREVDANRLDQPVAAELWSCHGKAITDHGETQLRTNRREGLSRQLGLGQSFRLNQRFGGHAF